MKIEELLSEDTTIDESLLSKMFGKLAQRAAIGLRKITRPKQLTAQEKKFKKHINDIKDSLAKIKSGGIEALSDLGKVLSFVNAIGMIHIVYKWYDNMENATKNLESGAITQAQYDEEKRIQYGLLVTDMAAGIVGSKILSAVNGLSVLFKWLPLLVGPTIAITLQGMTVVARTALWTALSTQEGSKILADLISVKITEGTGSVVSGSLDKLNDLIKWAENKATGTDTTQSITPSTSNVAIPDLKAFANKNKQQSAEPAQQPQPQPAASTGSTTEKDNFYSPIFDRDPATGQLKFRSN